MIRKFPMKHDLLTSEELSKYINITPGGWAVRRSKKDGPPFIKIKNDVRYLWEDVLKWISKESSHTASRQKRNELLYKRFEEIKIEMPNFSNKRIAHIIAHEFNLTIGTAALYIQNYVKKKKEENQNSNTTEIVCKDPKINKNDSFKHMYERYEEIKEKHPFASSAIISDLIAAEINLSKEYVFKKIRTKINENKEENQAKERQKSIVSKKSSLSELGSAILSILKSKNSINNKNL
jgi:hypothetical protein